MTTKQRKIQDEIKKISQKEQEKQQQENEAKKTVLYKLLQHKMLLLEQCSVLMANIDHGLQEQLAEVEQAIKLLL